MDYLIENWGSFVGLLGVIVSAVGLWYAFRAHRAARSAEQAANEARNSINRTLCLASAQRALAVIGRLNTLHRDESWIAALELYRELRTLLNDVSGMMPTGLGQSKEELVEGIGQLRLIQSLVGDAVERNSGPENIQAIGESLNSIQKTLETLVRNIMPLGERDGELHG